jgi:hypothetical protein
MRTASFEPTSSAPVSDVMNGFHVPYAAVSTNWAHTASAGAAISVVTVIVRMGSSRVANDVS